jgi:hypothetical protein
VNVDSKDFKGILASVDQMVRMASMVQKERLVSRVFLALLVHLVVRVLVDLREVPELVCLAHQDDQDRVVSLVSKAQLVDEDPRV